MLKKYTSWIVTALIVGIVVVIIVIGERMTDDGMEVSQNSTKGLDEYIELSEPSGFEKQGMLYAWYISKTEDTQYLTEIIFGSSQTVTYTDPEEGECEREVTTIRINLDENLTPDNFLKKESENLEEKEINGRKYFFERETWDQVAYNGNVIDGELTERTFDNEYATPAVAAYTICDDAVIKISISNVFSEVTEEQEEMLEEYISNLNYIEGNSSGSGDLPSEIENDSGNGGTNNAELLSSLDNKGR